MKKLIIGILVGSLLAIGLTASAALPIYKPEQGGTGKNTKTWTGLPYVTAGVWATTSTLNLSTMNASTSQITNLTAGTLTVQSSLIVSGVIGANLDMNGYVINNIGTTTPSSFGTNGQLYLGTTTANGIFYVATTSPMMTILQNGRVGIGTASPSTALTVNSTSGISIYNATNTNVNLITVGTSTTPKFYWNGNRQVFTLDTGLALGGVDRDMGGSKYRIMGNVSYIDIGISVVDIWSYYSVNVAGYYGGVTVSNATDGYVALTVAAPSNQSSVDIMQWKKGTTVLGVVDVNGKFGIGTSTPAYTLDVKGTLRTTQDVYVSTSTRGIILTSPDNSCSRCTVSDIDILTCAGITCP